MHWNSLGYSKCTTDYNLKDPIKNDIGNKTTGFEYATWSVERAPMGDFLLEPRISVPLNTYGWVKALYII